jgi:hypothetical protein
MLTNDTLITDDNHALLLIARIRLRSTALA